MERCGCEKPPVRIIFLESMADSEELLENNYRLKVPGGVRGGKVSGCFRELAKEGDLRRFEARPCEDRTGEER